MPIRCDPVRFFVAFLFTVVCHTLLFILCFNDHFLLTFSWSEFVFSSKFCSMTFQLFSSCLL